MELTRCASLRLEADAWPEGVDCGETTRPRSPTGVPLAAAAVVAVGLASNAVVAEIATVGEGVRVIGVVDGRPVVADREGSFGFAGRERRRTPGPNMSAASDGDALLVLGADGAPLTDGGSDDTGRRLAEQGDVSFSTPFGYIDVHHSPAGFRSYAELRRGSRPIRLERGLSVQASSLRDIIRSRLAAGDDRQLPALEAALEMESGS